MKKILPHFQVSFLLAGIILSQILFQALSPFLHRSTSASSSAQTSLTQAFSSLDAPSTTTKSDLDDTPLPDPPADTFTFTSDLIIRAVNPGYSVDQQSDVGELIELQKTTDAPLSLAGYAIQYTNSSGNHTLLLNFDESSSMAGETLLMRLARSPGSDQSDATYMTTLGMSTGRVAILHYDEIVDTVCWGGKKADGCYASFKSAKPTTLVRNLQTGKFEHLSEYAPSYDPKQPSLILPPPPDRPADPSDTPPNGADGDESSNTPATSCRGLEFSEIYSYYADNASEQFIELYNSTSDSISLDACSLRYKKKLYSLSGQLAPDSYFAFYPAKQPTAFTFTKNPTTSNTIELIDQQETVIDALVYAHGQKKSTSFARFFDAVADELWMQTYHPTPGQANTYQEFRTCPEGKVINPATGNCVKSTATSSSSLAACPDGKYRNPLTGRCKKIDSDSTEPKPCAEGYERNPETNRCRKKTSSNEGAGYALVPTTYSDQTTFVALGIVVLLVSLGVIYIILQFRHEITRAARKARQRLHYIRKDLIARRASFHRKKKP